MSYVVNYVTEVATALAMARSDWKRNVDEAIEPYRQFKRFYPDKTKYEWLVYSGRLGIDNYAAHELWDSKGKPTYGVPKILQ